MASASSRKGVAVYGLGGLNHRCEGVLARFILLILCFLNEA